MTIKKLLKDKYLLGIIFFLLLGVIYKVYLTSDGNFIFNMDNGRDLVDVREMVELKKPRLIGHTSGIEGFYNGPGWYYTLAIPYIFSNGHPYSAIILMILMWAVGGYFLLKILRPFGMFPMIVGASVWIASNYIMLSTVYAFNPNPLLLLMPVFIYFLGKFIESQKLIYSLIVGFISGLFFNYEMAFGIFLPIVVILTLLLSGHKKLLLTKNIFLGGIVFILSGIPQLIFELKHNFLMFNSLTKYFHQSDGGEGSLANRFIQTYEAFFGVFVPTLMNLQLLTKLTLIMAVGFTIYLVLKKQFKKDLVWLISLLLIIVPFIGFLLVPMTIYSWHLTGSLTSIIILLALSIFYISKFGQIFSKIALGLTILIVVLAIKNLDLPKNLFAREKSPDVSVFTNELAAVDWVFDQSGGRNFKVYTYLPSVIDYPYQYLFWWRGKTKYGYIPEDYAYLPNKPAYISGKEKLLGSNNPVSSGLVFLIKEPDRINQRHLWENSFNQLSLQDTHQVGGLVIEKRSEDPPKLF